MPRVLFGLLLFGFFRSACGMRDGVVNRAFRSIGQDRVSIENLFEFIYRTAIVRVAIGMITKHQLAVGPFDFFRRGSALNTEQRVVVNSGVQSVKPLVS